MPDARYITVKVRLHRGTYAKMKVLAANVPMPVSAWIAERAAKAALTWRSPTTGKRTSPTELPHPREFPEGSGLALAAMLAQLGESNPQNYAEAERAFRENGREDLARVAASKREAAEARLTAEFDPPKKRVAAPVIRGP